MSYDVFVFDPDVAPQNRESFLAWWEGIISSDTTGDESSPDGASENIRDFCELLKEQFPPMNGPDAACNCDQIPVERVKKVGLWKRLLGQTIKDYNSCEDLRVSVYTFFGDLRPKFPPALRGVLGVNALAPNLGPGRSRHFRL